MSAVTGFYRLPILAIAALLAAGCGANPAGSASPAPGGSTTPSATPTDVATSPSPQPTTAAPSVSPQPTVEAPAQECPSTTSGYDLANLSGEAFVSFELEIESLAPIAGGEPSAIEAPREPGSPASFFVGGRETRLQPSYATNEPRDLVMSELRGRLVMDDGSRHDLEVRLEAALEGANVAVVRIPDIEGKGTIRISLAWRDSCYMVSARTSGRVIIERASSIAGCAVRGRAGFEELAKAFAPPIQVGPLAADLLPWHFTGKAAPLVVIDPSEPYVGFDRETPTMTISPGASVTISSTNPRIELALRTGAEVTAYRRAPLIRWLEGGWIYGTEPRAEIVFRSPLVANDDGTFSFAVPTEPGRYGLEALFEYDAECSFGTAGFVVGIDVATP